jgi:ArsR family transcriptional regulator, arsenate/arsenite/antimonite-responsive transcriptional repressor
MHGEPAAQQLPGGQQSGGQQGSLLTSIFPPLIDGRRYVAIYIDSCQYEVMKQIAVIDQACCPQVLGSPLSAAEAEDLAGALRVVADPARLRLLSLIAATEGSEACVCDLTEPLGLSQPTVSHHLKVLTDAGLLAREQRGRWAFFSIEAEPLALLRKALTP